MDKRDVVLSGGDAGGVVIETDENNTQFILKKVVTESVNPETGEVTITQEFQPSDTGLKYEIRGDMAVYVGEVNNIQGE